MSASSLSLPKARNGTAEEEEHAPAAAALASDASAPSTVLVEDFLAGIILPPPDIRSIVDKTATFIAKNKQPEIFEEKMRAREKTDSRFAFMRSTDAYHAYYQYSLAEERRKVKGGDEGVKEKQVEEEAAAVAAAAAAEGDVEPEEPPALEFLIDSPPAINAVDLDILRLTALFTARSGQHFISELSQREARNYQFDFLRPSHSLFGYFNRTVEQYTKLLMATKEAQERLERRSGGGSSKDSEERLLQGRREVLKDAHLRAEWSKWESGRQKEMDEAQEAERIAIAEIDWQDFVVVSTVEFTEGDEAGLVELPPPMSISEVENMTIAQKKMAAMIMEGREEEVEEDQREAEKVDDDDDDDAMDVEEEEENEEEQEAAKVKSKAPEIRTVDSIAPMKIRKDYVPKSKRPLAKAAPVLTKFGDQIVPVEDLAQHIRIELIDPRYKEQKRQMDANRSASNLLPGGTDVSASLRALAANRADIFGTGGDLEIRKQADVAMRAVQKEREKNVWDGHTASKETTVDRFQAGANFDEQIEAIHRAKGLLVVADTAGPQIGPAHVAPEVPEPVVEVEVVPEVPSTFTSGPTIFAAPQPNRTSLYPIPLNPNLYPQQMMQQQQQLPYGQSMLSAPMNVPPPQQQQQDYSNYLQQQPPSIDGQSSSVNDIANDDSNDASSIMDTPLPFMAGLPARPSVANPGEDLPALLPTTASAMPVRQAEDAPDGEPSAKRQMTDKSSDVPSLYSEEDWMNSHPEPINLTIQLPEYAAKPEWGCDGTELILEAIPLSLLVGTLRDRIQIKTGLPIGKQRLSYNGKLLSATVSLASLNISEGAVFTLAVRDAKKK